MTNPRIQTIVSMMISVPKGPNLNPSMIDLKGHITSHHYENPDEYLASKTDKKNDGTDL